MTVAVSYLFRGLARVLWGREVLPMPPVLLESRLPAPLDAHDASYLAASARMASFSAIFTRAL